ncbi:MAG: MBL fold metallo-hydrolase [Spirochaetales bacterium]|nr:MBL fold metallo-hydrolase [Spirochaetales bacterium]MBO7348402.1 MBL fold metallo-hydrolase [Spirochaetales bacterium]
MSSKIRCISVGLLSTNCYIASSDDGFLAVIDPGDNAERILSALEKEPTHIILTHCHFDHIGALKELLERFPEAKLAVGEKENTDPDAIAKTAIGILGSFFYKRGYDQLLSGLRKPDILLKDGDNIGPFEVLHTPGHTSGSICLYDKAGKNLISGDTLFRHSYGRTDLGGSDEQMEESLNRLLSLDPDTKVFPGHGEFSTIGEERSFFF